MACYYYIKLPNGGEVKILATISTITSKDGKLYEDFNKQIQSHYRDPENSTFIDFLKEQNLNLHVNTLKSIIENSNKDTFLNNLNDKITTQLGTQDLSSALKRSLWDKNKKIEYINNQGRSKNISLGEFLNKIKFPISKKYFEGISPTNLIGIKRLSQIKQDLDISISELNSIGMDSSLVESLKNILNKTFYQKDRTQDIFYNINFDSEVNDSLVVLPEESNSPIIFYNGMNDMSLFMGTFKYLGTKLSIEELVNIINDYNKELINKEGKESKNIIDTNNLTVNDFFIGSFKETNKGIEFNDPEINKVFRFKKNAETTINSIISLISSKISDSETNIKKLEKDFKRLFKFIDPDKYGKGVDSIEQSIINNYDIEQKENKQLTNEIKAKDILSYISIKNRDYHYSRPIVKKGLDNEEDMYTYLLNNVSKNRDLLSVTILNKNKSVFNKLLVPTEFHIISGGIRVVGFYESGGEIVWEKRGFIFLNKGESEISHRQLLEENPIIYTTNAEELSSDNSIVIISPEDDFLPKELVAEASVRGGRIVFSTEKSPNKEISSVIRGVYPGVIKGNSIRTKAGPFEEISISTERVKRLKTDRSLFEDEFTEGEIDRMSFLRSLDTIIPTRDFIPVEKGDYIETTVERNDKKSKLYNKIVATSDKDVYILIKTSKGNYSVKPINKNLISKIFKKPISLDIDIVKKVGSFHRKVINDKSISKDKFSAIDSYEAAKKDDYLVSYSNGIYTIYKITNKENREGIEIILKNDVEISKKYSRLPEELNNYFIVTNRNIYSEHAIDIAEKNNIFLTTEVKQEESIEYIPIQYFVPKDYKIEDLTILGSGISLEGKIYMPNISDPIDEKIYKDITKDLAKYLNEKRKIKGEDKLYIKSRNNYYLRYNASLYQTDFTTDTSFKEKYLKEHSFVTLKNPNNPDKSGSKTYRIIGRSDTILTLEYAVFNDEGKLISIQKKLDLSKEEDKNSIKWLYVMKGSISHKEMTARIKEKELSIQPKTKEVIKERKELLSSISQQFMNIFKVPSTIVSNIGKPELSKKKAWIQASTDNKPIIYLNFDNKNTDEHDVVHEYLHLFLMPLKYKELGTGEINLYEDLMLKYKESYKDKKEGKDKDFILNSNDWSKIEEYFVRDVSKAIVEGGIEGVIDYGTFVKAFNESLYSLGIEDLSIDTTNLVSLLTTRMSEIFKGTKSKLAKSELILFDANFREWLSNNLSNGKLKINCE